MIDKIYDFINYGLYGEDNVRLLDEKILKLDKKVKELQDELDETKTELKQSNKKLEELLHKQRVNVQELKDWYVSRLGSQTWEYDWDGKGLKPVNKAFRYKDSKTGPKKLKELAVEIVNRYSLENPGYLELIERVKQYFTVKRHWTYVFDHNNKNHRGVKDYWQEIDVSIDSRRGDCEDLAMLMHLLIRKLFDMFNYKDYKWRLWFTAGALTGYGGHGFNLWLHDDGYYYVIESTYDLKGSFKRSWLKAPVIYHNLYDSFWGFANPNETKSNTTWKKNFEALKNYKEV